MSSKIATLVIVFLIIVGIIVSFYFYEIPSGTRENGKLISINGFNSGSTELLSFNGEPYVVIWDSLDGAIYLIPLNSKLNDINLSDYKPVWRTKEKMGPLSDMFSYGNQLYVAISNYNKTVTRSMVVEINVNTYSVKEIEILGKSIVKIFYWKGIWVEDWYGREYHIQRLSDNGSTENVYNFPLNITPVQENIFVHNGTLYYSFLMGHNTPYSTYKILAISDKVETKWEITGNFEYGFSTVVGNYIYTYLLKGSGNKASTYLYILNFEGNIMHKYILSPSEVVHWYGHGVFVGGIRNILYSEDGLHFKEIYRYNTPLVPLWPSQPHGDLIDGYWLYELAFIRENNLQVPVIISVELSK